MKNQCRTSYDAFHVSYVVKENDDFIAEETKNFTHKKIVSEEDYADGESELNWCLEIKENFAYLIISETGDELDINQLVSEETCFQLADMFATAGVLLREKRREKQREELKVQKIIDSQNLPFK